MTTSLALLLGLVLPGLAAAVLLARLSAEPPAPAIFIAEALAMGTGTWLIGSGALARVGILTATSAWIMTSVLATASVGVLLLPGSRLVLRERAREAIDLGIVLGLAAAVWWPVAVAVFRVSWAPLGSTPWYYWNLADQVAAHHHVPATSTEWGVTVPFLGDYHLFTTATAMLLQQGSAGVSVLHGIMLLAVVLVACGAWALATALGAGPFAAFLAVPVAVGTGVGALKLMSYRPEAFGLGLLLIVTACFVWWLRRSDRAALVCTCVAALAVFGVHGIAALTAGILMGAAALAFAPWHAGLRSYAVRVGLAAALVGAVVLVLGFGLGISMSAVNPGGFADRGGAEDPTWQFIRAIRGRPFISPPGNGDLVREAITSTYRSGVDGWVVGAAAALALVLLVVAAVHGGPARRQLGFFLGAASGLAALVAAFALGWEGYVPRSTGQRFMAEASLLAGPLIACGASHLPIPRPKGRRMAHLAKPSAPAWLLAVVLTVGGCLTGLSIAHSYGADHPSRGDVETLRSLDLPSDSTVLSNAYNEGYIEQVTGARGLVGGRAPFTFPAILDRSLQVMADTKRYFRSPEAHTAFLQHEGVDYVVVAQDSALGRARFTRVIDTTGLDEQPELTRIATTPDLVVYRVETPS